MHVMPLNYCPASFAAVVHNKERFTVKYRNLSLLRSEHCVRESSLDRSVSRVTPLLDRMVDGSFHKLEEETNVVPFRIGSEEFKHTWITADGIYPAYSRFVKGIKDPTNQEEKRYTSWQEAVRKDVERAVGVLEGCWQFLE
jgi:hypothetical protein